MVLAGHYERGEGVEENKTEAYAWYLQNPDAYEHLDDLSQKMSATEIKSAENIAQDRKRKFTLPNKQGGPMGVLCLWGRYATLKAAVTSCPLVPTVKKDAGEAYFWALLAYGQPGEKGYGAHRMGKELTQSQRFAIRDRAKNWKATPSEKTDYNLFRAHQAQDSGDLIHAVEFFLPAAQAGDASAQEALSKLYFDAAVDSQEQFIQRLDDAIERLGANIVANSHPSLSKAELDDKARHASSPYACFDRLEATQYMSQFTGISPEKFESDLKATLALPAPPQDVPCY